MIDYYELLGIKKEASSEEIKKAYKEMVKKYHPDINKEEDASKIIISLNKAKETLLDQDKKREYDRLLTDIMHSKQYSKEKDETYNAKTYEYRDTYTDTYITRWEYFKNYIKNSTDKWVVKLVKSLIIIINYVLFLILKTIGLLILYTVEVAGNLIDYLAAIMILLGLAYLFVLSNKNGTYQLSYISENIWHFILLTTIAIVIEVIKAGILSGSINLYAILQNIEDKIFIKVLTI